MLIGKCFSKFGTLHFSHTVQRVQIRSFFWSVFFSIRTEYGDLRSKSLYLVRIPKNEYQKNSVFGHVSRSVTLRLLNLEKYYNKAMPSNKAGTEQKSRLRKWFDLNYYRYELNTGIYMLEPWEKKLFSIFSLYFLYSYYSYSLP